MYTFKRLYGHIEAGKTAQGIQNSLACAGPALLLAAYASWKKKVNFLDRWIDR